MSPVPYLSGCGRSPPATRAPAHLSLSSPAQSPATPVPLPCRHVISKCLHTHHALIHAYHTQERIYLSSVTQVLKIHRVRIDYSHTLHPTTSNHHANHQNTSYPPPPKQPPPFCSTSAACPRSALVCTYLRRAHHRRTPAVKHQHSHV